MYTEPLNHLSAAQLNRLHDQARREARALRDAAIDEFWHRVKVLLRAGVTTARRSVAQGTQRPQPRRAGVGA
jgi:hypothetical protein